MGPNARLNPEASVAPPASVLPPTSGLVPRFSQSVQLLTGSAQKWSAPRGQYSTK